MKRYILAAAATALTLGFTSCSDWLEQEPVSQLSPDGFYNEVAKAQAAANQLYDNILPSHGGWDYGYYGGDAETDNQADWWPDNKYGTGLYQVGATNGNWSWTNVRNVNYQLNQVLTAYEAGEMAGSESEIRQYIGEIYFLRAYVYFSLLRNFGDLPIITEPLPDDEAVLVAANKREPCNEVARFIIEDLDTAIDYMTEDFDSRHQRISPDVARLFKSRVALFEGSWLRNFAGTPFVPGDANWPGASKAYNADFSYATGSVDQEAQYFFEIARDAAEEVAEKYKNSLTTNTGVVPQSASDPSNPYMAMWGTTDMSGTPEILLWRQYSRSLGVVNNVETMTNWGNYGIGLTRSYVESYLMADGRPIYNSNYTYSDNTIAEVRANRDPRLFVFLKEPGQVNYFLNPNDEAGDHAVKEEPYPNITTHDSNKGYSTGYTIRKGGMFDRSQARNGSCENAYAIFRATEALLNYMEAAYELSGNVNSGRILEYWKIVRKAAGFTGDGLDPTITIAATDMSKETGDWGAYTAGQLVDPTLYNIRRERRCEFIGESMRGMDLQRWRSYDQLMSNPAHIEGIHLYNTEMEGWYSNLVGDGTSNANVSSSSLSEYLRPHEVNMSNNSFADGLTWHMAHYLNPLPVRQFILTASDYATPELSDLYQNPYWTTTAGDAAQQ